ncbi:VOC family protein [Dyadobacter sandarakinus]|uniref:VOC family protein n=1 Tax=Dyadobacter sandarakinus TaxID=2747268 RepID=A0ABX7IAE9_9BACT|nr:VOC family protein [Dyadobacter sandarakinus]QRR03101.1 VOC family protein [Dyadobacter sandarakinus]
MKNDIYPCLWFNGQAREAAEYYCGIFKNARILDSNPIVTTFEANGNRFMCLNGGPEFRFSESVSFVVSCDSQEEIDYYWDALTADGGQESQCGWLKDKFGLSWQIIPAMLGSLMSDPEKGRRVMEKLLKMKKLELPVLQSA